MKRALALVIRAGSLEADLAEIARRPRKGDDPFTRTYVVLAGAGTAPPIEPDKVKQRVQAQSRFGAVDVFTPKQLTSAGDSPADARRYLDYLDETLWRKQASKEGLARLFIGVARTNTAALMAAAALAAFDPGVGLWDLSNGKELVDLALPRDRLVERLFKPLHRTSRLEEPQILGRSDAMVNLRAKLDDAAPLPFPVLLVGETGTGKELCAQALHAASGRPGRLLAVNAAFLAEDRMADSELFGHTKGAFTGAEKARHGRIREADGGTLFLDELDSLAIGTQARLLRALARVNEARIKIPPLGDDQEYEYGVRLITAIHHDDGPDLRLRADLFHRVNTITIRLPPLRERRDDILLLAEAQLAVLEKQFSLPEPIVLQEDAARVLLAHHWPGNVRELQSVLIQGFVTARGRRPVRLSADDLQPHLVRRPSSAVDGPSPLEQQVARLRVAAAEYALARHPGNKADAARELGYRSGQGLERMLERARATLRAAGQAPDDQDDP